MNLVRIEGAEAVARGLRDIPDAIIVWPSLERLDDGRINVAAYATDRAIAEVEARGLAVTTVSDNAALEARLAELLASIGRDEPPFVG